MDPVAGGVPPCQGYGTIPALVNEPGTTHEMNM